MSTADTENEFDFYLKFAKPLVLNLNDPSDRVLAAAWITKLKDTQTGDLKLRVDYLKLLLFVLQRKRLVGVFSETPNHVEKLELPATNLHDAAIEILKAEKENASRPSSAGGDHPPYIAEYSADLLEYSAAQDIPHFGVQGYYAISNEPLSNWDRTEKAIFPRVAANSTERGRSSTATSKASMSSPVSEDTSEDKSGSKHKSSDRSKDKSRVKSKDKSEDKPRRISKDEIKDTTKPQDSTSKSDASKEEESEKDQSDHPSNVDDSVEDNKHNVLTVEAVRLPPPKRSGPPSPPLSYNLQEDKEKRTPPTWGSNLIGVTEPPVRELAAESLTDENRKLLESYGSHFGSSTYPSLPYKTPSPKRPCIPCSPQYTPQMPSEDRSAFFLESPPYFLDDTPPYYASPYRPSPPQQRPPSYSPQYSPQLPLGDRSMFFAESPPNFLDATPNVSYASPYRPSPPQRPQPLQRPAPVVLGAREYDLDELNQLGLNASDLGSDVLNLDDLDDINVFEESESFSFKEEQIERQSIDDDLDAFDRMIAEFENDDFGGPPPSPYKSPERAAIRSAGKSSERPPSPYRSPQRAPPPDLATAQAEPYPENPPTTEAKPVKRTITKKKIGKRKVPSKTALVKSEPTVPEKPSTSRPTTQRHPPKKTTITTTVRKVVSKPSIDNTNTKTGAPTKIKTVTIRSVISRPNVAERPSIPLVPSTRIEDLGAMRPPVSGASRVGSRIPGPGASQIPSLSRIPGSRGSKIPAPGSSRIPTSKTQIPGPGTSRIPAPGTSRIPAPGSSRIPAPGRTCTNICPGSALPPQSPPYSPILPVGDEEPFFLESPPSFFDESTLPNVTGSSGYPSVPYRTPPYGTPSLPYQTPLYSSRSPGDPSVPYRTPPQGPKVNLSLPSLPYRSCPARQAAPSYDVQQLKELGLEPNDLEDIVFDLDEGNISEISITSIVEYQTPPELKIDDRDIDAELDEWDRQIAELEAENAEDMALYGSPERGKTSPAIPLPAPEPKLPPRSPSKPSYSRVKPASPVTTLSAEEAVVDKTDQLEGRLRTLVAAKLSQVQTSPGSQAIIDQANRLEETVRALEAARASRADIDAVNRQQVALRAPVRVQRSPGTQAVIDEANRYGEEVRALNAAAASRADVNEINKQQTRPGAPDTIQRSPGTQAVIDEANRYAAEIRALDAGIRADIAAAREAEKSLDSFEEHEAAYGANVHVAGAMPPIPTTRIDPAIAQKQASKQYNELVKKRALEDEYDYYKKRYQQRRPDMPLTPPIFSKYRRVMGTEGEREYDASEFGEVGEIDWQPAEQFFKGRTELSPRVDARGSGVERLMPGLQRQPESEYFFDQETEPEFIQEFEESPVHERSPAAGSQDFAKIQREYAAQLSQIKETTPAEAGLPVTTPQISPSPRRSGKSIRVEGEAGEICFDIPEYESPEPDRLYWESPPQEYYRTPDEEQLSPLEIEALSDPHGLPKRVHFPPMKPVDLFQLKAKAQIDRARAKAEQQRRMLDSPPPLDPREEEQINFYIKSSRRREVAKRVARLVADVPDTFEPRYQFRDWELPQVGQYDSGLLEEPAPEFVTSPPPASPRRRPSPRQSPAQPSRFPSPRRSPAQPTCSIQACQQVQPPTDFDLASEVPPEDMYLSPPPRTPPRSPVSPYESPMSLRLRLFDEGEPPYYSQEQMTIPMGRTSSRRREMLRRSAAPTLHRVRELPPDYAEEHLPFLSQVEAASGWNRRKAPKRMRVARPPREAILESPLKAPYVTQVDIGTSLRHITQPIVDRYADLSPQTPPEDLMGVAVPMVWQRPTELDRSLPEGLPSPLRPPTVVPGWSTPPHLRVPPTRRPHAPVALPTQSEAVAHKVLRDIIGQEIPPEAMAYSPPPFSPGDYFQPERSSPSSRRALEQRSPERSVFDTAGDQDLGLESPPQGMAYSPSRSKTPPSPFRPISLRDVASPINLADEAAPEDFYSSPPPRTPPRSPDSPYESPMSLRLRLFDEGEPPYYSQEQMTIPMGRTSSRRREMLRRSAAPTLHRVRELPPDYAEEHLPFLSQVEAAGGWKRRRAPARMRVARPPREVMLESPLRAPEITQVDIGASLRHITQPIVDRYGDLSPQTPPDDLMGMAGRVNWRRSPTEFDRDIPEGLPLPIKPPTVVPGWQTPPRLKKPIKPRSPYEFKLIPPLRDVISHEEPPPGWGYSPEASPPMSPPRRSPIKQSHTVITKTHRHAYPEGTPQRYMQPITKPSPYLTPRSPGTPPWQAGTVFEADPQYLVLEMPPEEFMPAGSPQQRYSPRYVEQPTSPDDTVDSFEAHERSFEQSPLSNLPFASPVKPQVSPRQELRSMRGTVQQQYEQLDDTPPQAPCSPCGSPAELAEFEAMERLLTAGSPVESATRMFHSTPRLPLNAIDRQYADLYETDKPWLKRVEQHIADIPDPHLPRRRPLVSSPAGWQSPEYSPVLRAPQPHEEQLEAELAPEGVFGYESPRTPPSRTPQYSPEQRPVMQPRNLFELTSSEDEYLDQVTPPKYKSPRSLPTPPRLEDYYAPHTPPQSPGSPNQLGADVETHQYTEHYYDKNRRLMSSSLQIKNRRIPVSHRPSKRPVTSPIREAPWEGRVRGPQVPEAQFVPVQQDSSEDTTEIEEVIEEYPDERPPLLDRPIPQAGLPSGLADPGLTFRSPPRAPRPIPPSRFTYVPGPQYRDELAFQSPPQFYKSPERDIFEESGETDMFEGTPPAGYGFSPPPLSPCGPCSPYMGFTPPDNAMYTPSPPRPGLYPRSPIDSPSFAQSVREHQYTYGFDWRNNPQAARMARNANRRVPFTRSARPQLHNVRETSPERYELPRPIYYGSPGREYIRTPMRREPPTDDSVVSIIEEETVTVVETEEPVAKHGAERIPFSGQGTRSPDWEGSPIPSDLDDSFIDEEMSGFRWMG